MPFVLDSTTNMVLTSTHFFGQSSAVEYMNAYTSTILLGAAKAKRKEMFSVQTHKKRPKLQIKLG